MNTPQYRILSSEYISNHQYFTARKDRYETPSGKIVEQYFVVEMPDCAVAVAFTEDDKIILIEQYRHAIAMLSTELPGGFIDANEEIETGMARELQEETGYTFSGYKYLGKTYSNPGVLNNVTHLYMATGGKKTSGQSLDPNEEIKIIIKTKKEVKQMMAAGDFKQSMHELALYKVFELLKEKI